jgi:hypothetical protein
MGTVTTQNYAGKKKKAKLLKQTQKLKMIPLQKCPVMIVQVRLIVRRATLLQKVRGKTV